MPEDGEGEKKEKDEEEESELFVGDCVRIAGSMAEVKKHLEVVDMTWEGSFMGVLGKNGVVKSVRFHPGDDKARQICVVNVHDGPEVSLPGASLTVVEDDESDKESVDKGSDEEEEEEEEERVRVPLRVNMRVEDTKRKKKKKVCIGVILELGESETNVKYEDGRTKRVANTRLRPLERVTRDATGYSGDSSFNDFRFTKNCLPTGIEVVGDGADLEKNRAGQSYLHLKKNTYLRVPLRGLRHEKLRPGEPIPRYTLSLEVRLADSHRRLGDSPWSLFQASFPDPHSTDELCVVAEDKPHKRKWKVLTKENGLVVTAEADPNSKELCRLPANAVVVEDGIPPKRLPTGERRLRIRYKADAAKQAEGDLIDAMEPEEYIVEVEAGYFGSDFGTAATSVRVCSKGVLKTLNFRPGVEGGAAGIDSEQGASMGWTPRDRTMHTVRITIRKTGWHTFEIIDGSDSEKTWSKDFKVLGWFDDYKGISGIAITDPDNEELELGKEREYHNSGTHKLRLRRMGEATADVDDKFDPRGWVTIRKTDMELVEEAHGQKAAKGPQCFLRAGLAERPVTSNRYLRSDRWHTVTITSDCQDRTVLVFLDGMQATEKEINIGTTSAGLGADDAGRRVQGPVSPLEMLATSGLLTVSPYAVPQAGFLLFASSSARGMPGGIMLRRITFYNTMLGSQQVEEQYLNSRYQREKKPPPQQLALSPAMKKSAPYLWIHGSFLCEFADCFISSAGGDLVHLLRSFVIGLEGACKSVGDGPSGGAPLWSPQQQTVLHDIVELFQRSEPLFKKWQPLWTAEDHAVPSLAASYVRRLQTVRQNLRNQGGRLLIPLGIKTLDIGSQMIMLILEKQDGQTYRLTIINSGMPGLDWHATSSAEPPKFKSQAALAFDNIPSWKAEDDAFWAMLVVTSAIPPSPMMAKEPLPIYDKFIPWLIGCPLEHYLVTNVYAFDGQAPEQEQCEAGQDLRTPQYGGTGAWRCMTFALRFLLRDAGLPVVGAKFMKWHLRRSFLKLAIKDLASASALSTSERTILRIAAKQFALGAVKVSNRLAYDAPDLVGAAERLLCDARAVVSELEAAVNAKPGAHHVWNDPSAVNLLNNF
ncbi:unnamed protein product [Durusdinium trenchii]|uniref:Uncharacterized protein n=1 Tax=Durusdinium trenchii TaxID=1381693 RepID=A0ABP0K939_9DINO